MGSSGSALYTDAEDYEANLPGRFRLLTTGEGSFRARLTWMELEEIHLLNARERLPRIAYVALPAKRAFAIFPVRRSATLICGGIELRVGDIIFHQAGARFHQRSTGAVAWGSIALTSATLRNYGSILTCPAVAPPACSQILRPASVEWRRLLRLHAEAIRIAETRLSHLDHPQVARAVEQDLIWALVTCVATAEQREWSAADRCDVSALVRFEEALIARADRPMVLANVCNDIGVSAHALRSACSRVLGMPPAQYLRLRHRRQLASPAVTLANVPGEAITS